MAQGLAAAVDTGSAARDASSAGIGQVGPSVEGPGASLGTGLTAAPAATYVLFTDADISWAPTALRDLVRAAEDDDRALVSQMALLRAETAWERVIVPAFVYFFAQLYPFKKVNNPKSRTSAGAGGCMLIAIEALERAGGLEPMRGALIDDVALGTLLKKNGNRIWLGLTTDIRSDRPYPSLASLWHMIARSAYVQLRYNPALLAGTLVGLLLLYAVPPAGLIASLIAVAVGVGSTGAAVAVTGIAGLLGWALMTASYVPMLRFYRLSPLCAPALPLIAILYAAMTADSARRHYSGRAVSWRGRAADRV
jgi:hopene-associated glycosyltransferase HpnB